MILIEIATLGYVKNSMIAYVSDELVGNTFQFSSNEMAEEVEEFFSSRVTPSFARNLKQSIEEIRIKAKWIEKVKQEESLIPKLARGLTRSPMST